MILTPFGWSTEVVPGGLLLVHPGGTAIGSIAYRYRERPLQRVGVLVRQHLAGLPSFVLESLGAPERLVTHEGEHAALVTATGSQAGARAQRDLGFVFGDDFYASVSAICLHAALHATFTTLVRDLVLQDAQVLGVRRRRFVYAPPPGWQPVPQGLTTEWIPPGYPGDLTSLRVYPATPIALVPGVSLAAALGDLEQAGFETADVSGPHALQLGNLLGESMTLRTTRAPGVTVLREVVCLRESHFSYLFELSSQTVERWLDARGTLRNLLESVRPVPISSRYEAAPNVFGHWVE